MDEIEISGRKANRVRRHLLEGVTRGRFSADQPLPSETELAATFGVCRNTVRRAFGDLERQGLIRRIRGKGTFLRPQSRTPRTQQLEVFALVLPEVRRSLYPSLIRGFGRCASELAHQVMVCQTDNDVHKQADIILQLMDKKVAGVAIVPTTIATPGYHIRELQHNRIPVVLCHRTVSEAMAPCVTWDWEEVGRMAARRLLDLGHQRIAFLSASRYGLPETYAAGMRQVMQSRSLDLPEHRVDFGDDPAAAATAPEFAGRGRRALERMLAEPDPPTAVFCHDDTYAEELYLWAVDRGLRVPGDLSILGAGDAARDGAVSRRLACVTVDEARLGRRAAELLEEMSTGTRAISDQERVLMPLAVSQGETLGRSGETSPDPSHAPV